MMKLFKVATVPDIAFVVIKLVMSTSIFLYCLYNFETELSYSGLPPVFNS
jgi:hypothetical protein